MSPKRPDTTKLPEVRSNLHDLALMDRAKSGDEAAFTQLVERHQPALLNFFRRLGAHVEEAEDAVQETFLRLHVFRNRYQPSASFKSFLFTVAHHAYLDLCRRRARHQKHESRGVDVMDCGAVESLTISDRLDLEAGLAALPPGQRMVVVMSIFGGLRYEEIAEVLKIPEGTVKSRVFHAMRKLRGSLARDMES